MNVVLVTHDTVFGRYLAGSLNASLQRGLDRVILERSRPSSRFYWQKLRRVGPVNFVFQYWLSRQFIHQGAQKLPQLEMPTHESVANVNHCDFGLDDLVIGFGTSYVKASTLASIPRGLLNLHTGFLPDYRGVKSEFWALYEHAFDRLGWTLHYMTPRLDEGDIVLRRCVTWGGESPAALRAKLLCDAVPNIALLIETVRARGFAAISRTPQGTGRYFSAPRLRDWFAWRATRRVAYEQLSRIAAM
jgi:Formyl transferase